MFSIPRQASGIWRLRYPFRIAQYFETIVNKHGIATHINNVTTFMKTEVIEMKNYYVALKFVIYKFYIYEYLIFHFASRTKDAQRIFLYLRIFSSRANLGLFGACAHILAKIKQKQEKNIFFNKLFRCQIIIVFGRNKDQIKDLFLNFMNMQ